MYYIQLQSILIFLDTPNGMLQNKVKKQWQ
jgi:hypothetical protein